MSILSILIALVVVVAVSAATAASVLTAATSASPGTPSRTGRSREFRWHLVLRCRNESKTIGETLDHLATAFPEAEIWVADECSTDETADVVERLGSENPHIHLVRISRSQLARGSGYVAHTVYWAISRAIGRGADRQRTIVGLIPSVTRVSRSTLDVLADRHHFGYTEVGGVQIGQHRGGRRLRHPYASQGAWRNFVARVVFRVQDIELRGPIPAAQMRRHRSGSAELSDSGQFIRLAALDAIADRYGTAWPAEAEDGLEQSTRLALAGWRTAYTDQVWVTELGRWSLSAYVADRSQTMARALRTSAHVRELWRPEAQSTAAGTTKGPSGPGKAAQMLPRRRRFALAWALLRPWCTLGGSLLFLLPPALFILAFFGSPADTMRFLIAGGWVAAAAYIVVASVELCCWGVVYGRRIDPRAGAFRGLGWGMAHLALVPCHYAAMWGGLLARLTGRDCAIAPAGTQLREVRLDHAAPAAAQGQGEGIPDMWSAVPPQPAPIRSTGGRVVRPRRTDRPTLAHEGWTGTERTSTASPVRSGDRRVQRR